MIIVTLIGFIFYILINLIVVGNIKKIFKKYNNKIISLFACIISYIIILMISCLGLENNDVLGNIIIVNIVMELILYPINLLYINKKEVKEEKNKKNIFKKTNLIKNILVVTLSISIILNIILSINYSNSLKKISQIETEYKEYQKNVDETMCEFNNHYVQIGDKFYDTCKEGIRFKPIN